MSDKNFTTTDINFNAFNHIGMFNDLNRLENAIGDLADVIWFIKGMGIMNDPHRNPFTSQPETLEELMHALKAYKAHLNKL